MRASLRSTCRTLRLQAACALALGSLFLFGACHSAESVDIPNAQPSAAEAPQLSWFSTSLLGLFLEASVLIGSDSGYVAVFARDGQVVHAKTAGYADIESQRPMRLDTHFRIASMTKPVTAVGALILIEDGKLALDDPVERYIPAAAHVRVALQPDFDSDGTLPTQKLSRPLTVRDLITFSSGIGSDNEDSDLGQMWAERRIYLGEGSLEDRVNRLLTAPLYEQPGERWRYGWSADVLARVVEVASQEPFDSFLERRIFEPLGMSSTRFLSPEHARVDLATVYTFNEEEELVRVEKSDSDALGWTPGGSGLVSTAGDYMRFALMLWNDGTYDGVRILKPETVSEMTRPHVESGVLKDMGIEGLGWGLGLAVVVDSDATLNIDRDGDFWWSGYYGTTFFVSPETGLTGVVLSQNKPGPYSGWPVAVHLAQAFAFWGI